MALTVRDVLAERPLKLRLVVGADDALGRTVRWAAVTELPDPRPFLDGSELVLTTGLRQRTAAAQREFIGRIAERGVAAVGFGTGLTHERVPPAVVRAATAAGLPLLEVPYGTPFIAVDRFVAGRVLESAYGRFQRLLDMHDELARSLLTGQGLTALVSRLGSMVDAPVAVIDHHGSVLAAAPARTAWPIEQVVRPAAERPAGLIVLPVRVEDAEVAFLCARRPRRSADVLPYAVALIGLELARRQAELSGRRELVGQVLGDLVSGAIAPGEAERRLVAYGLDTDRPHAVVLGTVDGDGPAGERLRTSPFTVWPLVADATEPVLTAYVGEHLAAIVAEQQPVHEVAHLMAEHLRRLGGGPRVGVGGGYAGGSGLRWSFYEAREALVRGEGVNEREPLSLTGLLLASDRLPVRELGRDVLAPLLDADARLGGGAGGSLVDTLRAYLELDGRTRDVAARLFVHPNTVRYRLAQIERLTGRSLASTQDRVQLWLALLAVQAG